MVKYHKADAEYSFLSIDKVKGFDSLNSSLFEPAELERETIFLSNLQDECLIPIHSGTVLKNSTGKRLTGTLNGLDYLFAFLEAYDFSSEGAEEIQEKKRTMEIFN